MMLHMSAKRISVQLPPYLDDWVSGQALREHRSVSAQVLTIVENARRAQLSPPTPPAPPSSPRPARGTRLPEDFEVTPEMAAWAQENCPRLLVVGRGGTETEKFRDYWRAAPGAKGVKKDWPATWRNWMRKAEQDLAAHPPRQSHQPSEEEFEALRNNWARPLDVRGEVANGARTDGRPGAVHRPALPGTEDQPGDGGRLV
jgi:hypothetical protein